MHILASNPDAIGDFVLRQPMYSAIQKAGHRLTLIVRDHVAPLAPLIAPGADILLLGEDPYSQSFDLTCPRVQNVLRQAREVRPDRVLIAPYQWTAFEEVLTVFLPCTPVVRMTGFGVPSGNVGIGFEETNHIVVPASEDLPELTKNELLTATLLGVPVRLPNPRIEPTEGAIASGRSLLGPLSSGALRFLYACVGRTDHTNTRNWNAASWATFLAWATQHFDADIVFGGTPEEYEATEQVRSMMGPSVARTINITRSGRGLDVLLGMLALAKGYIGHDTGPMHLAAALGKPVVAVFAGGHWPRFVPNASSGLVMTVNVPCRGCRCACHLPEPYCISLVRPEMLIEAARKMSLDDSSGLQVLSLDLAAVATPETPVRLIETSLSDTMGDPSVVTSHVSFSVGNDLAFGAKPASRGPDKRRPELIVAVQALQSSLDETRAEVAQCASEIATLNLEISEWKRRNEDLGEEIARVTVECQSLRSSRELERYRHQVELTDAQKRLAATGDQITGLHVRLRELLAERRPVEAEPKAPLADLERLELRLKEVEEERERLQEDIAGSVALRIARSLAWILSPIRRTIVGPRARSNQ